MLPDTGMDVVFERVMSSIMVHSREMAYGTRAHTIILVDNDFNMTFIETSRNHETGSWQRVEYELPLTPGR